MDDNDFLDYALKARQGKITEQDVADLIGQIKKNQYTIRGLCERISELEMELIYGEAS